MLLFQDLTAYYGGNIGHIAILQTLKIEYRQLLPSKKKKI